jgi:hypothetical protein
MKVDGDLPEEYIHEPIGLSNDLLLDLKFEEMIIDERNEGSSAIPLISCTCIRQLTRIV